MSQTESTREAEQKARMEHASRDLEKILRTIKPFIPRRVERTPTDRAEWKPGRIAAEKNQSSH